MAYDRTGYHQNKAPGIYDFHSDTLGEYSVLFNWILSSDTIKLRNVQVTFRQEFLQSTMCSTVCYFNIYLDKKCPYKVHIGNLYPKVRMVLSRAHSLHNLTQLTQRCLISAGSY